MEQSGNESTIRFPLPDWPKLESEMIQAKRLENGYYELLEAPFYAHGVSRSDIVTVINRDGILEFDGSVQRGGHSTYRIFRFAAHGDEEFRALVENLEQMGCLLAVAKDKLISVDIPPRVDIYEAYAVLQAGEEGKVWEFEEGHCGHELARAN